MINTWFDSLTHQFITVNTESLVKVNEWLYLIRTQNKWNINSVDSRSVLVSRSTVSLQEHEHMTSCPDVKQSDEEGGSLPLQSVWFCIRARHRRGNVDVLQEHRGACVYAVKLIEILRTQKGSRLNH